MVTFDGKGLTLTNSSFMCNKAKDRKTEAEAFLESISFIDGSLSLVGSDAKNETERGLKDLDKIQDAISTIKEMNAFIAYFAEGRKAVEEYKEKALKYPLEQWAKDNEIEFPVYPVKKSVTFSTMDDVMNEMSIGDKVKYLSLEAEASVYGKYIHNDGKIAYARKRMHNCIAKPIVTKENGRDTLFYYYSPSVDAADVDAEFTSLQNKYREAERALNKMKSDLRETLRIKNAEETVLQNKYNDEYQNAIQEYNLKFETISNKHQQFLKDEEARLSKLKIEIPNKYESLIAEFELEFDESEILAEAKDCGLLNIAAAEPVIIKKDLNEFEEQIEWLLKKYSVYADDFKGRQDVVDFIKAYAPQVMATAKRIIAQNIIHSIDNEDY